MTDKAFDPSGLYDPDVPGSAPHAADPLDGSDTTTVYPAAGTSQETALALFDAADKLGLDSSVVRSSDGGFEVPQAVADKAKLPDGSGDTVPVASAATVPPGGNDGSEGDESKSTPRKATPRKAAAK